MTAYPIHHDMFYRLVDTLKEIQGDRCGICGIHEDHNGRLLDIDHEHTTGMVRGLLCRGCNLGEGRHGAMCRVWRQCRYCLWRQLPAVTHVGWTTNHSPSMDVFEVFDRRGFAPTEGVAERQVAKADRDRAALVAALRSPRIDAQRDEMGRIKAREAMGAAS